ncbi:MGMT family protein [Candidatus Woesearchaeota archaeon]|nr:MGMT family protein [Candidatus Woesearchaeota archaeon]
MNKQTFNGKIYEKLRLVPFGKVVSYKDLASSINSKAYRMVGRAMKLNEDPINIKCFKVVKSNGEIGNYSLGVKEKIKRLKKENIEIKNNKIDLEKYGFKFC